MREKTLAAVSEKPLREMRRESTFESTKLSKTAAISAPSQSGRHLSVCKERGEEEGEEERARREKPRKREEGGKYAWKSSATLRESEERKRV